jgi:hypothetical protein
MPAGTRSAARAPGDARMLDEGVPRHVVGMTGVSSDENRRHTGVVGSNNAAHSSRLRVRTRLRPRPQAGFQRSEIPRRQAGFCAHVVELGSMETDSHSSSAQR